MVAEGIIFICYIIYYMLIHLTSSDLEVKKDMPWLEFLWHFYIAFPLFPDNYLNLMLLWMWLKWSHLVFCFLLSIFREVISHKNNTWLQGVIYLSFNKTFKSSTFISSLALQNSFIYSPVNSKYLYTISQSWDLNGLLP